MALTRSPLFEEHIRLSAKIAEFAGWEMPISYPSGTLEEHRVCRSGCVMFDVSHLGAVSVKGKDAYSELQYIFTNDLSRISQGKAQYSHLLNEEGHVIDDVIIWWIGEDEFVVMPNASNTKRVEDALRQRNRELDVRNSTKDRAVIAIQGPKSRKILETLSIGAANVKRFHVENINIDQCSMIVAGTGYTGEDGVEISVPTKNASWLWNLLKDSGCFPAGLGARDTLRLEAGLPLHGNELGEGISPIQANMKWVVSMTKGDFIGRKAIESEMSNGPKRLLRGFASNSRRPLRRGQKIALDGIEVGEISSGNFSPTLGSGIGMGYIPSEILINTDVVVSGDRSDSQAKVVKLPFYSAQQ